MHNHANEDWQCHVKPSHQCRNQYTHDEAQLAVLMDIRGELRRIRDVLECPNATEIPEILRSIRANTSKPKRKKKAVRR